MKKHISTERRLELIKKSMSRVYMDLDFLEAIKLYAEDCIMDVRMKKPWHDRMVKESMEKDVFSSLRGVYNEEPKCES